MSREISAHMHHLISAFRLLFPEVVVSMPSDVSCSIVGIHICAHIVCRSSASCKLEGICRSRVDNPQLSGDAFVLC